MWDGVKRRGGRPEAVEIEVNESTEPTRVRRLDDMAIDLVAAPSCVHGFGA